MAKYGSVAAQSAEAGRRAAVWTSFIRGIVVHLEKDEDLKRRLDEEEIVYLDRVYDAIRALPLDHPLFNEHIEDISKRLKPIQANNPIDYLEFLRKKVGGNSGNNCSHSNPSQQA